MSALKTTLGLILGILGLYILMTYVLPWIVSLAYFIIVNSNIW